MTTNTSVRISRALDTAMLCASQPGKLMAALLAELEVLASEDGMKAAQGRGLTFEQYTELVTRKERQVTKLNGITN